MRTQLVLASICIYLCAASAGDVVPVEELLQQVQEVRQLTLDLSFQTKGIEEKFKHQRDEIADIDKVGITLTKLELGLLENINTTISGVANVTAIIAASQIQGAEAIQNLTKVEGELRNTLGEVEVSQNKYEKDLDTVAANINTKLADIEQLLRQAIIGELIGLDHKAQELYQQQKEIDNQVGSLEEVNALAGRANRKLQQLECGLNTLNRSQSESLSSIEVSIAGVEVATSQIDQKIGVLLGNQQNIEKTLEGCKKWQSHHHKDEKPHEVWTHPEYHAGHPTKPDQQPKFQTTFATEEDASYLYKLWYGKGQD
ncbi:hypothetical protein KR018_010730 [Drosophila ironensis]|nr:hypothetical protein KR018_010730 [Drosophila ironensis]